MVYSFHANRNPCQPSDPPITLSIVRDALFFFAAVSAKLRSGGYAYFERSPRFQFDSWMTVKWIQNRFRSFQKCAIIMRRVQPIQKLTPVDDPVGCAPEHVADRRYTDRPSVPAHN